MSRVGHAERAGGGPPSERTDGIQQEAVYQLDQDIQRLLFERVKGYGTGELPLELNSVAKGLGAVDIRYLAREVHGLTDFSNGRPVVYLAMSKSDGRRRFTLAHECGHLLLGQDGANALVDPYVTLNLLWDLERTCDHIASELVLPRSWLEEHGATLGNLQDLRLAARAMRVSPAALVVGLRRVGSKAALVRWRRARDGRWVPVHRVGLPPSLSGQFGPSEDTSRMLDWTLPSKAGELVDFEVVTLAGGCYMFEAYLSGYADSAISFIPDTRRGGGGEVPGGATRVWSSTSPPGQQSGRVGS